MIGRSSDVFLGQSAGKSRLEQIHREAKQIINEKNKEIQRFSKQIQEAEVTLSQLKGELQEKTDRLNKNPLDQSDSNGFQIENEISELNARHQETVRDLLAKHEDEMQNYRTKYGKMLKESEHWVEQHIDTVYVEKAAKVEAARQDLEKLKKEADKAVMSATMQKTNFYKSSKTSALMNTKRIEYLESQLSEITSLSREEICDIRAKIEECLAAITVREKEHKAEVARYKREISEREKKYDEHLSTLKHQCETEKERYQNQIDATNENIDNLTKVLRQLEKHHETQMKSTMRDLERMKTTIYSTRARTMANPVDAIASTKETNTLSNKCIEMQQEIAIIESELQELNDENKDLKVQLARFDNSVYA